jgi:hypothetical protein
MFETLKASFEAEATSHQATIWSSLTKDRKSHPNRQKIRLSKYYVLVETAKQLKNRGHTEELDWLVSRMISAFPDMKPYLARHLDDEPKPSTHPATRYAKIHLNFPSLI